MKIIPISNIKTQQPQFKAKFPKQNVQEFLREIEYNDIDMVPKLYTMLDIIKKHPGQNAQIEHLGMWNRICIDGKSLSGKTKYFCAIHALHDATVKSKTSRIETNDIKRLSEEEFENEYYKNSKKTTQDIENIFEE